ncbi:MAG: hypothetical protein GY710_04915 [Desulfobacteraceae bacterium]|nr:hypothetical protein [Desulfobacteraceae bacterium]
MTDKIDNLFSPERLRGKWISKSHVLKQKTSKNGSLSSAGYEQLYSSIQEMIGKRFSGDNRQLLEDLLDQLKPLLDLRFPGTDGQVLGEEEIVAANMEIDQALSQIEDLVEAFEIQGKSL